MLLVSTVKKLKLAIEEAVDDYLDACKQIGKTPDGELPI